MEPMVRHLCRDSPVGLLLYDPSSPECKQKNILVVKGKDTDGEFIIQGVFQTSRNDFYFTPDVNFDPANVFQGCFADIKLNCRLTVGRDEDFTFSSQDFSVINFHSREISHKGETRRL